MPYAASTFRQVEERLVERISALDASEFTIGTVPAKWRESKTPLSVIADSSALGHLAFNVWTQNAPNTNDADSLTWKQDDLENQVEVDTRLVVAFAYNLRSGHQTEDTRRATDAAIDVVRAVMAAWDAEDEDAAGSVTIRLVDALQVALSIDGHWMLVTQDYIASFDIDLLPSNG